MILSKNIIGSDKRKPEMTWKVVLQLRHYIICVHVKFGNYYFTLFLF